MLPMLCIYNIGMNEGKSRIMNVLPTLFSMWNWDSVQWDSVLFMFSYKSTSYFSVGNLDYDTFDEVNS